MEATPIDLDKATPLGAMPFGAEGAGDAVAGKWAALHEAAAVVAVLAGIAVEPAMPRQRDFPQALRAASAPAREAAELGLDDLTAIMEPGLAALIAIHGRGGDPGVPAQALWQEFVAARDALLALVSGSPIQLG